MNVLQINSVYKYGSTGKIVYQLHQALKKDNYQSSVIYARNGAIGNSVDSINDENIFYINSSVSMYKHLLLGVLFDKHGLYSKNNTKKIIEKIEEINPDIIHMHNIHGFYVNYPMLFKYLTKRNKPVVWTLHDCWSFTGFCSHYDYNECDKWKTGCDKCQFRNVYPYRILSNSKQNYKLKQKAYDDLKKLVIVTPSNWLKDQVSKSILKNKDIRIINNNVDLSNFYYDYNEDLIKKYKLEGKEILLAVAGMWTEKKGYKEYLKLSSILEDKYKIVMVGLTKKQIESLPKNILGIEKTQSQDELRQWYSISKMFVNLTLEDTYPTVNLEAHACGLPIISYRTGGSTEMMTDKDILVDKYHINEVLDGIERINYRLDTVNKENKMIEEYIQLYREVSKW